MKIYIAHSRGFDYTNELYKPIKSIKTNHEIIFPHDGIGNSNNPRDFYDSIDLIIAECSYPSTGLGIELGFAFDTKIPIYCLYKNGKKISSSLKSVSNNFYEYSDSKEMINYIVKIITNFKD